VLLVILLAVPTARAKADPQLTAASQDVWSQSLQLIETGRFDTAASRLQELEQIGPRGARVAGWLRDRQDMEQTREEMTQADREKYIAWVKEQRAKAKEHWAQGEDERAQKNLSRAIEYAVRAFDNTAEADRDAFRAQHWLGELYDEALARAAELREKSKWLDAHGIYYQFSEIFEHDEQLRRLRHECLTHARLEVTYKPDGKWEDYLAGIEWRMVPAALYKIEQHYVTEADFRRLTIAGLEQLLLLVRSPAVQEVFQLLQDEHDRGDFVRRIERRIDQTRELKRLPRTDAAALFRRALNINLQTVQLPEPVIISEFMDGAMDTLDDFSSLIWPVEFREFDKHTRGDFIGVGISISLSRLNGEITVVTPLEDSPAYYAGILADDVIVKVDGRSTENLSLTKAVEIITGPVDTSVVLTVRRNVDGVEKEIDFKLTRQVVTIQSVKGFRRNADDPQHWDYMIDPELGIGYIRVGAFQDNTVSQLWATIERLRKEAGLEALILDLRFNPGGLLRSSAEMTELFLTKGDKIVSTKGERSSGWPIFAKRTGPFVDLPLVVLINGASASASEIVSGALKDHARATIIGERTFGKFSVQNLIQLDGTEAHLKLTTAAYYLPSGKSLHRTEDATEWGVDPDIDVPLVPKELYKVIAMRRQADILGPSGAVETAQAEPAPTETAPADAVTKSDTEVVVLDEPTTDQDGDGDAREPDQEEDDPPPADPNNRPEIDPQLETALLVMRAHRFAELVPRIAYQAQDQPKVGVE